MKKKILLVLASIVAVAGVFCSVYFNDPNLNKNLGDIENKLIEEIKNDETINNTIIISEEVQESAAETIEATENGKDLSTTEIIESTVEEEENVTDEGALETDAVVEQENISYDGTNTGNGLSLLGSYQGLTYYSQADSRWANVMYSSIGDSSQTMKSSACGPTSAAIIVSSSKGTILPTTMASLFVENGYRTSNNGTAWSAFPFVADYFDFNEYYTTSSFDKAMSYLSQKDANGNSKYYIIASCGSGLFTTGGHYITLVSLDGNTIQVYDPYLYSGKFTTASRRAANVEVSGNSVFVSESSFKLYANYRNFWIFSNDSGSGNTNTSSSTTMVNYTRYVATESANLNVRSGAGTNYSVITSLAKGTAVTVSKTSGNWSYIISPVSGWVSTQYLSSSAVTTMSTSTSSSYNVKITASALNIRTGASTKYSVVGTYKKGNIVTIISTSNGWGKTSKGWIYLGYTTKVSSTSTATSTTTSSYTIGTYKVTASLLNVRSGAGTSYSKKTYSQLTANARSQNKSLGNYYANGYLKGVVCTVTKVSGNWGYTPSGWICLTYCQKI